MTFAYLSPRERSVLIWSLASVALAVVFILGVVSPIIGALIPTLGAVAVASPPPAAGADVKAPPVPLVPFVQAAHEHVEGAFATAVITPGANGLDNGPYDVPAYGYVRHIRLEVDSAGGALGAGVLTADYPWNLFERVSLMDVNGTPIFELDGYSALWANIVGGYVFEQDPRSLPGYVATINSVFTLRIPVEINHFDGLGCISNQNSASSYKLTFRTRPSAQLYSTAPTTIPTFTVRAYLEAWSVPNEVDIAGRPQEQYPPMHGTAQYWLANQKAVNAGANTTALSRTGNFIRNLIFIARNNTMVAAQGTRDDTVFPDPVSFKWDNNELRQESRRGVIENMHEKIVDLTTRDTGVFFYSYAHSELGRAGDGPPSLWLATTQASRIEIVGNSTVAGALNVITNDIAPIETQASERYEQGSRTGQLVRPTVTA
jgi:hypothetical protein